MVRDMREALPFTIASIRMRSAISSRPLANWPATLLKGHFLRLAVYAQSEQTLITQQFVTISALGTLGCAAPQLRFHIGAGFNVGITQEQIVETIAWIQFFAGAPAAYNALTELKAALAAGTGATPGYQ